MNFKLNFYLQCLVFFSLSQLTAQPFVQRNMFGLKVSTTGAAIDVGRSFGKGINFRVGGSYFTLPVEFDADDFQFSGDLNLVSGSAMVDWFPMKGFFRFTGGTYINFNKAKMTLTPTEDQTIGGINYSVQELGTVEGDVTFNVLSPYLGLGLGNAGTKKGLTFILDLGVIYHGSPQVQLTSGPLLAPSAAQAPDLENNLDWARWYPVLALGLAYRL